MQDPYHVTHLVDSISSEGEACVWDGSANEAHHNSKWAYSSGTSAEEDWTGFDLSGNRILEVPVGLYQWYASVVATQPPEALDGSEVINIFVDHATDASEVGAPNVIAGLHPHPFGGSSFTQQGIIRAVRPFNRFYIACFPINLEVQNYQVQVMRVG